MIYNPQGGFLEGPAWVDSAGALFFSEMSFTAQVPPSRILKLTPPSTVQPFVVSSGSNGLTPDNGGQLLAATHDTQALSRFDVTTGARAPVAGAQMYMGRTFNSPNDVVVRADGNIYFSDPDWQLGGRTGASSQRVYRLSPSGDLTVVEDFTTGKPNGVGLSPDGSILYVDAVDGKIRRYAVDSSGATTKMADMPGNIPGPDGMAIDCAGNLYVAGSSNITVLDPAGRTLGTIVAGGGQTTNAGFGGLDGKTLFITAGSTGLFSIVLNVPGLP